MVWYIISIKSYLMYDGFYKVVLVWWINFETRLLKCGSLILFEHSKHQFHNSTDACASKCEHQLVWLCFWKRTLTKERDALNLKLKTKRERRCKNERGKKEKGTVTVSSQLFCFSELVEAEIKIKNKSWLNAQRNLNVQPRWHLSLLSCDRRYMNDD